MDEQISDGLKAHAGSCLLHDPSDEIKPGGGRWAEIWSKLFVIALRGYK